VFISLNPFNLKEIARFRLMTSQEIKIILEKCHEAQLLWQRRALDERLFSVNKMVSVLRANAESYAELISAEMGKPQAEARLEIEKCARLCDYYAENAADFLKPELIKTEAKKSFVAYEPLGIILGIMPWNFPFWQVFRFALPSVIAGNGVLLKHASNVTACAVKIENIFLEAGFDKDIFKTLIISHEHVEDIIKDNRISAVSLTGSSHAGSAIAQVAGKYLKKCVLELGGSDAYVILADADLEKAAEICVKSRLLNNGQSCISAKRFIVLKSQQEDFTKLVLAQMKAKKFGDPRDENNDLGPMARHDLRDALHEQVKKSIGLGAHCLLGGEIPKLKGAFYPPTILSNVQKGMPAYDEEIFGPVAAIISAADENDAIRIANDSQFGLGACVFTSDLERGEKIALKELAAGSSFVNALVHSDPRLPFGGIKQSGFGRELGLCAMREFVNIKTVYIA
jgi:succinate-semialdehyde dehydrogenase/glutarate-semialdehyde dehydrogenase